MGVGQPEKLRKEGDGHVICPVSPLQCGANGYIHMADPNEFPITRDVTCHREAASCHLLRGGGLVGGYLWNRQPKGDAREEALERPGSAQEGGSWEQEREVSMGSVRGRQWRMREGWPTDCVEGVDVGVDPVLVMLATDFVGEPGEEVAENVVAHGVRKHDRGNPPQLQSRLKSKPAPPPPGECMSPLHHEPPPHTSYFSL